MPKPRCRHAMCALDESRFLMVGGKDSLGSYFNDMYILTCSVSGDDDVGAERIVSMTNLTDTSNNTRGKEAQNGSRPTIATALENQANRVLSGLRYEGVWEEVEIFSTHWRPPPVPWYLHPTEILTCVSACAHCVSFERVATQLSSAHMRVKYTSSCA